MGEKGVIPIRVEYDKGPISEKTKAMAVELFSFDYQFRYIRAGKRNVSKRFKQQCLSTYGPLYFEIKAISEKDDYEGKFAKAVMQSLKVHMDKR